MSQWTCSIQSLEYLTYISFHIGCLVWRDTFLYEREKKKSRKKCYLISILSDSFDKYSISDKNLF